ncbi:hypothetical protein HKD37_16G046224 [Glycine soja]
MVIACVVHRAEINIKPWHILLGELKEGTTRIPWLNREPYAYWKGNPAVAETRQDLMKCNVYENQDWNARLFAQDWFRESQEGFNKSDLPSQCTFRYKVYIEGSAWSVSQKYILSCDSTTLLVKPKYYDFFHEMHHYWPIKDDDKCRSIKFAVDWGNNHKQRAHQIGKVAFKKRSKKDVHEKEAGVSIWHEDSADPQSSATTPARNIKMDYVYDYMFHLLNSYAKLFRYKPSISANATELCVESMVCGAEGSVKKFMMESLVKVPANTDPCTMPAPFDPPTLYVTLQRKESSIQQVKKKRKVSGKDTLESSGSQSWKSKVSGTQTSSVGVEQDKGVSVKDYLVDKLRPGDEDRALSEVISETLHKKELPPEEVTEEGVRKVVSDAVHKRDDDPERKMEHQRILGKVTESEEVKRRLGGESVVTEKKYQEMYVNSPGKGVVDKLKGMVGTWFTNPAENQSSQGRAEVEQVNQGAAGERRQQESSN